MMDIECRKRAVKFICYEMKIEGVMFSRDNVLSMLYQLTVGGPFQFCEYLELKDVVKSMPKEKLQTYYNICEEI